MMFWLNCRCQRASGAALFVIGLLGDSLVGALLLLGGGWQIFFWHLPCALLWGAGVNLIAWQGERRPTLSLASLNKWGLTALLLGVGTFPGFGSCTYSLAFLLTRYLFSSCALPGAALPEPEPQAVWSRLAEAAEHHSVVLPLVDDVREGNTEARRAVVAKMSRAAHPDATQLLRQLLADGKAEIRSDASVALAHLEDQMSRALNLAFEAWSANPADTALSFALADHYYQYAASNVLDRMSQRFYLVQARDLLLQVIAQEESKDARLWLTLARIRQRLGEPAQALQDALHALHIQPGLPEASLLAMELAFHTHSWDILASLAASGRDTLSAHTDKYLILKSLQQWATPLSASYAGTQL